MGRPFWSQQTLIHLKNVPPNYENQISLFCMALLLLLLLMMMMVMIMVMKMKMMMVMKMMPVRKQQVQNPTILRWRSNKICVIGCWPHDTPAAEAAAVAAVHMVENVEHKIIGRLPPHHTTAA